MEIEQDCTEFSGFVQQDNVIKLKLSFSRQWQLRLSKKLFILYCEARFHRHFQPTEEEQQTDDEIWKTNSEEKNKRRRKKKSRQTVKG